jgi:Holliday junction resolvase RusA-like endonuclease
MKIILPGDPIAKQRPRFLRKGRAYDLQASIKLSTRRDMAYVYQYPPISGALKVSLEFCFEPPKYVSRAIRNLMLWNIEPHNQKPDFDNCEKFICDAGNSILWCDDSQIVKCHTVKKWSNISCTIIEFNEINNSHMDKKIEKVFRTFSPDEFNSVLEDMGSIETIHNGTDCSKEFLAAGLVDFSNKWAKKLCKILNES